MTKKDTLSMLLGIAIGGKNTFYDWYLNASVRGSESEAPNEEL
jgi:hypothetical protein